MMHAILIALAAQTPTAAPQPNLSFVFLNKGTSTRPLDEAAAQKMQSEHVGNLGALGKAGKGLMAGPLGDNGFIRGIVVLNVKNMDELKECFKPDPFIQNDYLAIEAFPCTGDRKAFHPPNEPFKLASGTLGILKKGEHFKKGPMLGQDLLKPFDLVFTGEFTNATDKLGVYIFRSKDAKAIQDAIAKDPSITSGRVVLELHPLYYPDGALGKTDS